MQQLQLTDHKLLGTGVVPQYSGAGSEWRCHQRDTHPQTEHIQVAHIKFEGRMLTRNPAVYARPKGQPQYWLRSEA